MSRYSSRRYRGRHAAPQIRRGGKIALTAVGAVPAVVAPAMTVIHHHSGAAAQAQETSARSAVADMSAGPASRTQVQPAAARPASSNVAAKARAEATARAKAAGRIKTAKQAKAEAARAKSKAAATARAKAKALASQDPHAIAAGMAAVRGWAGSGQMQCLTSLWTRESSWQVGADNPSSDAYGIPQALPGTKMASAGADWRTNPATQIKWGLDYIAGRYGSPCGAWAHEVSAGWY